MLSCEYPDIEKKYVKEERKKKRTEVSLIYQKKYHFPVEVFCTLNMLIRAKPRENDTECTDIKPPSNPPCVAILLTFSQSVFVSPSSALSQRVFKRNCAKAQARLCIRRSSAQ